MITAKKLTELTSMTANMLTVHISKSGYKEDKFTDAVFLGMTNGHQFCYEAVYLNDENKPAKTKVFITYDATREAITAEY